MKKDIVFWYTLTYYIWQNLWSIEYLQLQGVLL